MFALICFNCPQIHLVLLCQNWGRGDPATNRGVGSGRWPMKVVLECIMGKHADRKASRGPAHDEASLCFRLCYYPLLYLQLIKVHFVKYNYHSMMSFCTEEKVVLPFPDRGKHAHVSMVLGWASLSRDTAPREGQDWGCSLLEKVTDESSGLAHQLSRLQCLSRMGGHINTEQGHDQGHLVAIVSFEVF